jgi:hypothetical protein
MMFPLNLLLFFGFLHVHFSQLLPFQSHSQILDPSLRFVDPLKFLISETSKNPKQI